MSNDMAQRRQWYEAVTERDRGRCQYSGCRYAGEEVHHVLTKGSRIDLKFNLDNSILLCAEHHRYATDNSQDFKAWFIERYPDRAAAIGLVTKPDFT